MVVEFPVVENQARVQIIHNSPSPTVDIWINDTPAITDFEFRTATGYLDLQAGLTLEIGVAVSPSTTPDDIIATFPVNFRPDGTFIVIATGIVGNATTPFDLVVIDDAREVSTSGDVEFVVYHGSTDAPAVDVIARNVATLVTNAAYGDATDYIAVPAGEYILDVTPTGMNNTIVASYNADLTTLGGGSAVVFASGFLSPVNPDDPEFGLWVTLADGTTFPLDFINSVNETVEIEQIAVYPNPASDFLQVDLTLDEATELEFNMFDVSGRQVLSQPAGTINQGGFTQQIIVGDFVPGIYLLQVRTASGTALQKVVIE